MAGNQKIIIFNWIIFLGCSFIEFILCLPRIMVTSPGWVCTTTSSQLAIGRRPEVAAARLFTLASLTMQVYNKFTVWTFQFRKVTVWLILHYLVSTSLTSVSNCRSSWKEVTY